MPTSSLFNQYPPFPEDVPVISLPRLSYAKLLSLDAAESNALFRASLDHGFFLINLTDTSEGESLLKDVETAFAIGRSFFDLALEEKSKIPSNPSNVGYKPKGAIAFTDGKRDLTEICSVSRDSVLDPCGAPIPAVFEENRLLLTSLISRLNPLANLILSHLATHLCIRPETLSAPHDYSEPSATILRFLHNPPQQSSLPSSRQESLMGHTDNGSLTILFNILGGLQILPTGQDNSPSNWRWVRPEAGCAIVNIGDSLVQWTGGVLRSGFHRVLYAPGDQAPCERYSFGYFLKPAQGASMRRIQEGDVIPTLEEGDDEEMPHYIDWHSKKTKGIMEGKNNINIRGGNVPRKQMHGMNNEITA